MRQVVRTFNSKANDLCFLQRGYLFSRLSPSFSCPRLLVCLRTRSLPSHVCLRRSSHEESTSQGNFCAGVNHYCRTLQHISSGMFQEVLQQGESQARTGDEGFHRPQCRQGQEEREASRSSGSIRHGGPSSEEIALSFTRAKDITMPPSPSWQQCVRKSSTRFQTSRPLRQIDGNESTYSIESPSSSSQKPAPIQRPKLVEGSARAIVNGKDVMDGRDYELFRTDTKKYGRPCAGHTC